MKPKSPQEKVDEMATEICKSIESWKSHKKNGCNGPGWPDGLNMNLLRNHVIYYKNKILELCAEHNLPLPPEVYKPNLPYVDNNYFAKPKSERAQRIMSRPGWMCCNHEKPSMKYNENQLSLI